MIVLYQKAYITIWKYYRQDMDIYQASREGLRKDTIALHYGVCSVCLVFVELLTMLGTKTQDILASAAISLTTIF